MVTTVLNTLILLRVGGLRLTLDAGWYGSGPLMIGLAILGPLIWALSRTSQLAQANN